MTRTPHAAMKNTWSALLLACLVTFSLSFVGVSSAFAATVSHTNGSPNAITNPCLHNGAVIGDDGDNVVSLAGTTLSVCGTNGIITTVSRTVRVTNGCEGSIGTGPSTLPDTSNIPFNGTSEADYTDNVGCVICTYQNGVLTSEEFPDFIMFVTVSSSGSYKQSGRTILAQDTGVVQATITVQNAALNVSCPPTPPAIKSSKTAFTGKMAIAFTGHAVRR